MRYAGETDAFAAHDSARQGEVGAFPVFGRGKLNRLAGKRVRLLLRGRGSWCVWFPRTVQKGKLIRNPGEADAIRSFTYNLNIYY